MPAPYPKVLTAEKRADLEARGESWPVCDCHGEAMKWSANLRMIAGGSFQCAVRHRAALRRYLKTPKGRAATRRATARTPQRQAKERRYDQSPRGRARHRAASLRYTRRKAGWFEPDGMATDEQVGRLLNGFRL